MTYYNDCVQELVGHFRKGFGVRVAHPALQLVLPIVRSVQGDFNIWCSIAQEAQNAVEDEPRDIDVEAVRVETIALLGGIAGLLDDNDRIIRKPWRALLRNF